MGSRCSSLGTTASVALIACLAVCSPALAKSPTGDFAEFSACPRTAAGVNICLFSRIVSGEVKIGRLTVPINRAITLQGGIIHELVPPFTETFVAAIGGETLSRTPLVVPGGLQGVIAPELLTGHAKQIFQETVARGLTTVTATTELAGTPAIDKSNLVNEEGVGLSLPVRIRLDNPFLGKECYIGSSRNPVILNLTTGQTSPPLPNKPIHGGIGESEFKDEVQSVTIGLSSLVDNAFLVPRATGCGGSLSSVIGPVIDAKLSLPSQAGRNTAILDALIDEATTVGVLASEK